MNAGVAKGEYPPRHLSKKIRAATGLTQRSVRSEINRVRDKVEAIISVYAKEK